MLLPDSVQPSEITLLLFCLPSFAWWVYNWIQARGDLRAAYRLRKEIRNGRLDSGRTLVRDALTFIYIEALIIVLDVMLMFYPPNPASSLVSRWTLSAGFIVVSLLVMSRAYDRARVRSRAQALSRAARKGIKE